MLINRDWWEGETCCWSIVLAATYSSLNTCFCMYKESVMYSPPNLAVLKSKWHIMSVGSCFFWWFLNSKTNAFNVKNKHLCKLQPHITKIFKFKEKQLLPNYGYVRLWTWLKLINHARFHSMFTKYEDNTKNIWFTDRAEWPCHHSSVQFYFYPPRGHLADINKHWKLLALWYMQTNKSIQNYTSLKMYNNTEKKISIWQTLFEFVSCDLQQPIREHTKKLQVTWLT